MASLSALDRGRSTTAHSTSQTTVPSSSTGTTPPRASCQSSRPFVGTRTCLIWIWSSREMTNLACPRTREIGASSLHSRPPLQLSFPPWQSRTTHVHRSPSMASPTRYAPPSVLRQVVPAHASAPHGAPPRPPLSPPGIRGRSCAASTTAARGRSHNCLPPSSPQRSTEPPSTYRGCMQVLTEAPSPPPHRSTEPPSTYLGSTLRGSSLDGHTSSAHRLGPCCTASSWRQVRSSSRARSSSR